MRFKTPEQILEYINDGNDLYSPSEEIYIFSYNEVGSIVVYHITKKEATKLSEEVRNSDYEDYWSGFLGAGGDIYDPPTHECYVKGTPTNLDLCKDLIKIRDWILTKDYLDIKKD